MICQKRLMQKKIDLPSEAGAETELSAEGEIEEDLPGKEDPEIEVSRERDAEK